MKIPVIRIALLASLVVGSATAADTADLVPAPPATALSTPSSEATDPSTVTNTQTNGPTKASRTNRKASRQATPSVPVLETFVSDNKQPIPGTERVIFERAPLRVALSAGRERRIHLPWEAVLHLPADAGGLQAQIVGSTMYVTGQSGQPTVRAIIEGLEGQGMVPLDIQVRDELAGIPDEMEIAVLSKARGKNRSRTTGEQSDADDEQDEPVPPDLVQLTRHCSQQLFSPQRLVKTPAGVRPVNVRPAPVAGLYRGSGVMTTPIGAWRSSKQHVTAVRFTNRSTEPIELDMEMLRGRWVAATPQHYLLGPAGSESDTTAVCLISDQPFDAARP